jgi:tetratricopeptide (TPR) repeat protein
MRLLSLPLARRFLPLALALAFPLAAHTPADDPARKPGDRETLQQFLARLKTLRDGIQTQIAGTVEQILKDLEMEATVRRIPGLEAQRDKLIALGTEVAPLLAGKLDPGVNSNDPQKLVAQYVAQALAARPTPTITDALLETLRTGSIDGRRNALAVLAVTPEPARVAPLLGQFFRQAQGQIRRDTLTTLVKIGGADAERLLGEALADPSSEIVRFALSALAEGRGAAHAPRVLQILKATREASQYTDVLFAYYRANENVVDKPVIVGFLRIAEDLSAARDVRIKVMGALAEWGDKFDGELKKEVRVIAQAPEREIKESALILLHRTGDRNAKKELLAEYDEQIDRNKTWANSFEQRASVLYRLGDFKDAQRDYLQSIQLAKNDARARLDESYVGLARCYAQQNKLKEAATTLERAPVSLKQLAELAREPVFAKLVEHAKYRDVFKLN